MAFYLFDPRFALQILLLRWKKRSKNTVIGGAN
jgi:hypothetical protein